MSAAGKLARLRAAALSGILAAGAGLGAAACAPAPEQDTPILKDPNDCDEHVTCRPGDLLKGCGRCVIGAETIFSFGGCTDGLSEIEIEEALALSVGFVESLGALEDAVVHSGQLAVDFRDVLLALAYNPQADLLRAPFTADGKGNFNAPLASPGASTLSARFLFGADYEVGKKGDIIVPYPFRVESYLEGVAVKISDNTAKVSFTKTGPLVEMIGLGTDPASPFTLGYQNASGETRKQRLQVDISLDERSSGGGAVRLQVRMERDVGPPPLELDEPIGALLELVSLDISNKTSGQTVSVKDWSLGQSVDDEAEGKVRLFGNVQLVVSGGAFAYAVIVDYTGEEGSKVLWTCAP